MAATAVPLRPQADLLRRNGSKAILAIGTRCTFSSSSRHDNAKEAVAIVRMGVAAIKIARNFNDAFERSAIEFRDKIPGTADPIFVRTGATNLNPISLHCDFQVLLPQSGQIDLDVQFTRGRDEDVHPGDPTPLRAKLRIHRPNVTQFF